MGHGGAELNTALRLTLLRSELKSSQAAGHLTSTSCHLAASLYSLRITPNIKHISKPYRRGPLRKHHFEQLLHFLQSLYIIWAVFLVSTFPAFRIHPKYLTAPETIFIYKLGFISDCSRIETLQNVGSFRGTLSMQQCTGFMIRPDILLFVLVYSTKSVIGGEFLFSLHFIYL
jgi:hypothetical protein